jgi:hypothetical protein
MQIICRLYGDAGLVRQVRWLWPFYNSLDLPPKQTNCLIRQHAETGFFGFGIDEIKQPLVSRAKVCACLLRL